VSFLLHGQRNYTGGFVLITVDSLKRGIKSVHKCMERAPQPRLKVGYCYNVACGELCVYLICCAHI